MKIVGMIPARLGSSRVKKKNLRLLDGVPLVEHVVIAAKNSEYLDEVFINSEADIFREIAERNEIEFYKRPEELSSDKATNDDFAMDFINKLSCDILIQILSLIHI